MEAAAREACSDEEFERAAAAYFELMASGRAAMASATRDRIEILYTRLLVHRLQCDLSRRPIPDETGRADSEVDPADIPLPGEPGTRGNLPSDDADRPRTPPRPFSPIEVRGGPLSEDIIRDRR